MLIDVLRGEVVLIAGGDHLESFREYRGELVSGVASDVSIGAAGWPVVGEGSDHEVPSFADASLSGGDVPVAAGAGEEVEHGPVVPEVEGATRVPFGDVTDHCRDRGRFVEASGGGRERGPREVEEGEVPATGGEERVGEGTGAGTDVDDGDRRWVGDRGDEGERDVGAGLEPRE